MCTASELVDFVDFMDVADLVDGKSKGNGKSKDTEQEQQQGHALAQVVLLRYEQIEHVVCALAVAWAVLQVQGFAHGFQGVFGLIKVVGTIAGFYF